MKVLDLRPWWVRSALAGWRRGSVSGPAGRLTLADRWIGRRAARREPLADAAPWLISIGNLALGGTGKTPVVGALAAELARRGRRGAILVRGFGSGLHGPVRVTGDLAAAGDEARWHAAALAGTPWLVCQSRDRLAGLRWLRTQAPDLEFVLLEDAHQTARLPRHLDVVILDRWECETGPDGERLSPRTGPVFPAGPWRESAHGARRADSLLVESADPVPETSVDGQPVGAFERRLRLRAPEGSGPEAQGSRPWAALSGIARPERFERGVSQVLGKAPGLAVRCGDHQHYDRKRVARVRREMERAGIGLLVTTAKDWVKLEALWPAGAEVLIADLELRWGNRNALPDWIEERVGSLSAGGR